MLTNPMPPLLPLSEFLPLMAMRFREWRASRAARKFLRLPTPHPRPWWPQTPVLSMRLHREMLRSFRMEQAQFSRLCPSLGTQLQIPREWHEKRVRQVLRESLACAALLGEMPTEQDARKLLPSLRALSRAPTR